MKRKIFTRDEFMHEKNSIELVFCINAMYFLQIDVKVMQFFCKVSFCSRKVQFIFQNPTQQIQENEDALVVGI